MKNKYILPTIIIVSVLGLVASVFAYNHFTDNSSNESPAETINYDAPTKEQLEDSQSTKADVIKRDQEQNNDAPSNNPVSMYAVSTNTSGDDVVLRFMIDGVHTGTCSLVLTKGSESITKVVPVQALASSSTCEGYTIAKSELSNGTWSYAVTTSLDDGGAASRASGEFEL